MSNFPSLRPATRQFSFGEYPVSMQTGFGGGTVRFLHGIGRSAVVMELTYQNLTQAEAKLIRDHYRIRQGSHQDFLLPDALWAGHSGPANIVPGLTRWKYGSQPEETQKRGGYVDLTVSLISVTVITSMDAFAPGMNGQIDLALTAGSATGGGGGGGGGSDPNFSSVVLLLSMDGSNGSTTFTDSSSYGRAVTANSNAQISTAQSKYGGASGSFDGNGDYLATSVSGGLGGGNFTLEFWYYKTADSGYLFNSRTNGTGSDGFDLRHDLRATTTSAQIFEARTVPLNEWVHVAIARSGSALLLFINGTLVSTVTRSTNFSGADIRIGGSPYGNTGYLTGFIDDFRITVGIARYTANFTPPTAPFPTS